jgi:hypothetical protein
MDIAQCDVGRRSGTANSSPTVNQQGCRPIPIFDEAKHVSDVAELRNDASLGRLNDVVHAYSQVPVRPDGFGGRYEWFDH